MASGSSTLSQTLTPFNPIIPEIISNVDLEVMAGKNDNPFEMDFQGIYVNSEAAGLITWFVKVKASEEGRIAVTIGDVEVGVSLRLVAKITRWTSKQTLWALRSQERFSTNP